MDGNLGVFIVSAVVAVVAIAAATIAVVLGQIDGADDRGEGGAVDRGRRQLVGARRRRERPHPHPKGDPVTLNRSLFFLIAAIVCMTVALLLVTSVLNGDAQPWEVGGFLAFFLSFVP